MKKCFASFHVVLIAFVSLVWGCSYIARQPQGHVPGISALIHVGPTSLYPNQDLTPGKADTLNVADLTRRYTDNCPRKKRSCTYSEAHRSIPREVHLQVYDEYNVSASERNSESGEVDHFWPLCAGGSNDISNLWYQPAENQWQNENLGYHEKDWLEEQICKQIKAGQLDPAEAYKKLTTDWVAYYHEGRQQESFEAGNRQ